MDAEPKPSTFAVAAAHLDPERLHGWLARASELRFAQELLAIVDAEGRFLYVEGDVQALLGYPAETLIGKVFLELVVEEDRPRTVEATARLAAEGVLSGFSNRYRRGDGQVRHLLWTGLHLPEIGGALAIARPVDELAEAAERLRRQGALLGLAGRAAQLAGWAIDLRSGAVEWTPELNQMLDRAADDPPLALEESFALIVDEGQRTARAIFERCRLRGGSFDFETQLRTARGRLLEVRYAGFTETDEAGRPVRIIGSIQDISPLKTLQRDRERLIHFDLLTGLPNRRQLLEALERERAVALRYPRRAALLHLDIDQLDRINQLAGVDHGDEVLRMVAGRIRACAREGDLLARIGSDDFVLLMRELDGRDDVALAQVRAITQRIFSALDEPLRIGVRDHRVRLHVGVSLMEFPPQKAEALLREASLALAAAKEQDGIALRFYDPALDEVVQNRARLEAALRRALDQQRLIVGYEPQLAPDGRVVGAEALLRWRPNRLPQAHPGQVIELAEAAGLIHRLGQQVLEKTCRDARGWLEAGTVRLEHLSVNVSAAEFRNPAFVERVLATLEGGGLPPGLLTLELTETLLLESLEAVEQVMRPLKAAGVRFSLDDFGTGYSSLAYLHRLPFDQLKLDRRFVAALGQDDRAAGIVRSIIALGHHLGLKVVAEGVETEAQRAFLLAEGCDALQGFLFSRALAGPAFAEWVQQRHASGEADRPAV